MINLHPFLQALSFLTNGKQGCFPSGTHTSHASGLVGIVNNTVSITLWKQQPCFMEHLERYERTFP